MLKANRYIVFTKENENEPDLKRNWLEIDADTPEEAEAEVLTYSPTISVISVWERVM